jgi:putative ABC transport system permease protein
MSTLLTDLRYALRTLRKTPSFTGAAVLVMALGIGATTAIFSVVHGILLQPLDLPNADRLLALCEDNPRVPAGFCIAAPPNVADWGKASRTLESVGIGRDWGRSLRLDGPSIAVSGGIADPGFFETLGIRPALGRMFTEEEMGAGRDQVAVISYGFWESQFGGDPRVVGRRVLIDNRPQEIIGILPRDAEVPTLEGVQIWKPLHFDPRAEQVRNWRGFKAVGRMRAGVDISAVSGELEELQAQLAEAHPESVRGWEVRVTPLRERVIGGVRRTLLFFIGAVGLLLLIACANVANLLLARAVRRGRELAVRGALGASGGRLVRQLLTEAVVLALLGGLVGLALAMVATESFVALAPGNLPRLDEVAVNAPVLLFAFALSLLTATAFGLVPALRVSRIRPVEMLKEGARGSSLREGARTRGALIVAELALTMTLLVDAGLLTRSFANLLDWEPGFQRENLVAGSLRLSRPGLDGRGVVGVFEEVERQVEGLPGVISAGATSAGPIFGGIEPTRAWRPGGEKEEGVVARYFDISAGYFRTLGLPLLAGRTFRASDDQGAPPVAIVNQSLADRLWPGESAIDKEVLTFEGEELRAVVGVVADVHPFDPDAPAEPQIFFPKRQFPRSATFLVVRTARDPADVIEPMRQRVAEVDPAITIGSLRTMEDLIDRELVEPRFNMALIGSFAVLALVLAGVGIYGVLAYTVAQRTREIGIRMALGAQRTRVVRAVMGQGMIMAGLGLVLGLGLAMATSRVLANLLHGVQPGDPLTLAGTALFLSLISAAACLLPARRASRVDPAIALRAE